MLFSSPSRALFGGCVVLLPALGYAFGRGGSSPRTRALCAGRPVDAPTRDALGFSWQQTMLRIKDPALSLPYYEEKLGMRRIHEYHFDDAGFSLYFLASLAHTERTPASGSAEAEKLLWDFPGTTLELTHNHGTEKEQGPVYHDGNCEPHRGFGHIAFAVPDVYRQSEELEKSGVDFKKRPDEGRMKGLAFAYDPTAYWVELIQGTPQEELGSKPKFTLAQTMLRIKDPEKSLRFYCDVLGMKLLAKKDFPEAEFSLYFLQHAKEDPASDSLEDLGRLSQPVLELTHNYGTEKQEGPVYHNGNTDPRGFGHIGFLCNDLNKACEYIDSCGDYTWIKRPEEGSMRSLAFCQDPDGYWVELIQRGASFM